MANENIKFVYERECQIGENEKVLIGDLAFTYNFFKYSVGNLISFFAFQMD